MELSPSSSPPQQSIKILINNRDYTCWTLHNPLTFEEITDVQPLNPFSQKYFNADIFEYAGGAVIHSPIRLAKYIAGILVLEGNKTYGRTANKKRLLYKCIPDDKRLPVFLVPFEIKIGFNKKHLNKYVLFRFDHWDEKTPHGILTQTLGDADNLEAFYEYQLYRKSLQENNSTLIEDVKRAVSVGNNNIEAAIYQIATEGTIEDRTQWGVFTVDNPTTIDYDDAISISPAPVGAGENCVVISIYISNVFFVVETLGLWDSLTRRVTTIYLPDRRRPMLPSLLSDNMCSLQEGKRRFCFVCDVTVCRGGGGGGGAKIVDVSFKNALVEIKKNYSYNNVGNNAEYKEIYAITKSLDKNVNQANDVIAYWMIQTNMFCANKMTKYGNGIYRSVMTKVGAGGGAVGGAEIMNDLPDDLDNGTKHVIRSWNYTNGQYMLFSNKVSHEMMNTDYIHITSPIRRLVDLLNQTILLSNLGLIRGMSDSGAAFLRRWLGELEYINTTMRAIKKVQTDCFLLQRCVEDPDILEKTYDGILFDKLVKNEGSVVSYMVYLPELKLLSRYNILCDGGGGGDNYTRGKFRIFLFDDKDTFRKKIKIGGSNC
jgi:exoribonuclease R